ncbi:hypothetical protein B0F90DRAFT_1775606, partial [Multifurca ochricompacta]
VWDSSFLSTLIMITLLGRYAQDNIPAPGASAGGRVMRINELFRGLEMGHLLSLYLSIIAYGLELPSVIHPTIFAPIHEMFTPQLGVGITFI